MRRSICACEPPVAYAGEFRTWKFIYTPSTTLPQGTLLLFDIVSNGRPIDWEAPSTDLKVGENVIYAKLEEGKPFVPEEIYGQNDIIPKFQFTLPAKVPAGEPITIFMGDPKEKKFGPNPKGTQAQTNAQRRRAFYIYVDPTGKAKFSDPEVFSLDVKGNELDNIKAVTPSFVARNKRFDVVIRFEDQFGNLTSTTDDEDTLIELSHEQLRENLSWKLFIPETGYITLPNLYFNEPGVYTVILKNAATGKEYYSPPMKCFNELQKQLLWGSFHGESERVDSTENIESCLRHFRDELAYNFYGVSPSENSEETPNEIWKLISTNVQEFNEEDRFSTFLGFQWQGDSGKEGARQFVFAKDQKQMLRKKDTKYNTLNKIYKSYSPKEMISIPTFTMGKGCHYDFSNWNPEFERVVEIYNAWGSSECTQKEGNPCPIVPSKKNGVSETAEGSIQNALRKNCRVGFIAGGLDDRGTYYDFFEHEQTQYPPGLTAILAKNHNRDSIFEALYNRSCYATTGERIIVGISIAGAPMGSELDTGDKPGLLVNRHITGYVAGTTALHKIDIIRNGEVIHTIHPENYHVDYEFDDMTPLQENSIKGKDKEPPFAYYYLRVVQEDGHMAWSSPIWIDIASSKKEPKKSGKIPKSKNAASEESEE